MIATATNAGVKLMPLVMKPGFDQPSLHRVLTNPTARAQALRSLAALCRDNRFALGLAGYSDWWYPSYDDTNRARLRGSDISHAGLKAILARAGVSLVWDDTQKSPYATWEARASSVTRGSRTRELHGEARAGENVSATMLFGPGIGRCGRSGMDAAAPDVAVRYVQSS